MNCHCHCQLRQTGSGSSTIWRGSGSSHLGGSSSWFFTQLKSVVLLHNEKSRFNCIYLPDECTSRLVVAGAGFVRPPAFGRPSRKLRQLAADRAAGAEFHLCWFGGRVWAEAAGRVQSRGRPRVSARRPVCSQIALSWTDGSSLFGALASPTLPAAAAAVAHNHYQYPCCCCRCCCGRHWCWLRNNCETSRTDSSPRHSHCPLVAH